MVEHGGVVGITTNPTIFAKAIGSEAENESGFGNRVIAMPRARAWLQAGPGVLRICFNDSELLARRRAVASASDAVMPIGGR
jgi:hypothetical protein